MEKKISLLILRKFRKAEMAVNSLPFLLVLLCFNSGAVEFDCPRVLINQNYCRFILLPGQSINSGAVESDVRNPTLETDCPENYRSRTVINSLFPSSTYLGFFFPFLQTTLTFAATPNRNSHPYSRCVTALFYTPSTPFQTV
jgi:hypothetical protein